MSAEKIEQLVDKIESEILAMGVSEISSLKIGELVMQHLRKLDEVAYVRFASVYREFKDIEEFQQLLEELEKIRKWEALKDAQLPLTGEKQ